jgi:hypothetical protein
MLTNGNKRPIGIALLYDKNGIRMNLSKNFPNIYLFVAQKIEKDYNRFDHLWWEIPLK